MATGDKLLLCVLEEQDLCYISYLPKEQRGYGGLKEVRRIVIVLSWFQNMVTCGLQTGGSGFTP